MDNIDVKDYFKIHDEYTKKYNNKVIILIQVGSFYELYCYKENDNIIGPNLELISKLLDIKMTLKNKNELPSRNNLYMSGFPIYMIDEYINKLILLDYIIVKIDQTTPPPKPLRRITDIISPGTYINSKIENVDDKNILSIVFDKYKKNNIYYLIIGISSYNIHLNISQYAEFIQINNTNEIFDDCIRYIESNQYIELLINNNINNEDKFNNMNINEIISYLNLDLNKSHNINIKYQNDKSYQTDLFNKIFNHKSNINIFDKLELNNYKYARLSLTLLYEYIYNQKKELLLNIKEPELYKINKFLYLGNRSLEQLNIINDKNSLFNIINYTKTSLGKRFLYLQLTKPLINEIEIKERYDLIEKLINNNNYEKISEYLKNIYDIQRLIRKIQINMINPNEFLNLYESLIYIYKIIIYLKDIYEIKYENEIKELIDDIEYKFDLTRINNYDNSFYNKDIYSDIDLIENKIDDLNNFINNLKDVLEKYIDDKNNTINIKSNDRDGYYLLLTKKRCEILQNKLKDKTKIKVGTIEILISELEFDNLPKSQNTKINCNKIKDLTKEIIYNKQELQNKLKEYFKNDMEKIINNYNHIFEYLIEKISFIDFINSGAICSIKNHYNKPIINKKDFSFLKSKNLRHPIIEQINNNFEYIPHNIELGPETEQNGILLYGINSSGKSTLMKSIGINVIMAQIGYYTSSEYFEYSPYYYLFTRICGNDNIYKNLSSFMVELMDITNILKRNDSNTLVIGDEICKGTEEKSANIIVCYMLEKLNNNNCSFITATHLHKIGNLKSVKKLERVKSKHLKITYDNKNDKLIYNRELLDGQGESFYGLQVAKYIMHDNDFNNRTNEILLEYENINIKQSNYNKEVYLEECNICKSKEKLETHHIIWQKDFNENEINKNKFHIIKNNKYNLVVLCMSCHDKIDRNDIIINKWIDTSEGRILDYYICCELMKKILEKYDDKYDKLIEFKDKIKNKIIKLKNQDIKYIKNYIYDKYNLKLSDKYILSIFSDI
jgi:DNA mismatch repair protein MutS